MNELVFACLLRSPVCEKAVIPLLFIIFFFSTSSFRGFFFFLFLFFIVFPFFEGVRGEVGGRSHHPSSTLRYTLWPFITTLLTATTDC